MVLLFRRAVVPEEQESMEKCSSSPSMTMEVCEKQESESDEKNSLTVTTDILLIGSDFDKQPLSDSIDLSSDQDSTGGEDNDILGNCWFHKLFHLWSLILQIAYTTNPRYPNPGRKHHHLRLTRYYCVRLCKTQIAFPDERQKIKLSKTNLYFSPDVQSVRLLTFICQFECCFHCCSRSIKQGLNLMLIVIGIHIRMMHMKCRILSAKIKKKQFL